MMPATGAFRILMKLKHQLLGFGGKMFAREVVAVNIVYITTV